MFVASLTVSSYCSSSTPTPATTCFTMPASFDNIFLLLLTPAYTTDTVVALAGVKDAFRAGVIMSLILKSHVVLHSLSAIFLCMYGSVSMKDSLAAHSSQLFLLPQSEEVGTIDCVVPVYAREMILTFDCSCSHGIQACRLQSICPPPCLIRGPSTIVPTSLYCGSKTLVLAPRQSFMEAGP